MQHRTGKSGLRCLRHRALAVAAELQKPGAVRPESGFSNPEFPITGSLQIPCQSPAPPEKRREAACLRVGESGARGVQLCVRVSRMSRASRGALLVSQIARRARFLYLPASIALLAGRAFRLARETRELARQMNLLAREFHLLARNAASPRPQSLHNSHAGFPVLSATVFLPLVSLLP